MTIENESRGTMVSQIGLIDAFSDTLKRIREDETLKKATACMQARTLLYLAGYESILSTVKSDVPDILVVEDTTYHCVQAYAKDSTIKTAVLNFANAYTPGGSVLQGVMAQEECLCRSSNLYASLTLPYLIKNYYKWNCHNTGDMGTDAVIYSPGVTVFKNDDPIPAELDHWFQTDVLTCAAPYLNLEKRKPVSMDKLEQVFTARIKNVLEVAVANNVDIIVLGAFGCWVFNNPPDLVAEVFRNLLVTKGQGRFFKRVIFAIKKNNERNTNLVAFKKAFALVPKSL
jgi:uncharacterized protein (TIGR02452 family)